MSLPILYSFRRCPYAMRARLALWVSGTPVELREIELRRKPAALLHASPKGTVPVLVLPGGRVLEESLEIMAWALAQHDPEAWLTTGAQAALTQDLLQQNDAEFKQALDRYKYAAHGDAAARLTARAAGEQFLQRLEGQLQTHRYLVAAHRSLADMALMPFVRQFAGVDPEWWARNDYPLVGAWLAALTGSPLFAAIMQRSPLWQESEPL